MKLLQFPFLVYFLIFVPNCVKSQGSNNCIYKILEEPKETPLYCYEFTVGMNKNNNQLEAKGVYHIRKYTFSTSNKLIQLEENINFGSIQDSLKNYSMTKYEYDKKGNPTNRVKYNGLGNILIKEIFTYDKTRAIKSNLFSSNVSQGNIEYIFKNCNLHKTIEKDNEGQIRSIIERISDSQDNYTVKWKSGNPDSHFTLTLDEIKFDKNGNCIEYIEKRSDSERKSESFKKVYRRYIYSEKEISEVRSIDQILKEFTEAFRDDSFENLIDETYILSEETILLNSPFFGKHRIPGSHFVAHGNDKQLIDGLSNYFRKIRNRKRLNWSNIKIEKIEDRTIRTGDYYFGKDITSGKCELYLTDGNRNTYFQLNFVRVKSKWYLYQEK